MPFYKVLNIGIIMYLQSLAFPLHFYTTIACLQIILYTTNILSENVFISCIYRFDEVFLNVKAARKFHMIYNSQNFMGVVASGTALHW